MAAGATAAPSAKGIPKLDHNNDAPNEIGINSIVDAIDTLLGGTDFQAYTTGATTLTSGTHTEAAPLTLITFAAMTFDGVQAFIVELKVPKVTNAAGVSGGALSVWANGVDQGRALKLPDTNVTAYALSGRSRRLVPPAGTYSILVRGWTAGGNQTLSAGAGGSGQEPPITGRLVRVN